MAEATFNIAQVAGVALARLEQILRLKDEELQRLTDCLIESNRELDALKAKVEAAEHEAQRHRAAKDNADYDFPRVYRQRDDAESRLHRCRVAIRALLDSCPQKVCAHLEIVYKDLAEQQ